MLIDLLELYRLYPIGTSRILAHFEDKDVFVSRYDEDKAAEIINKHQLADKLMQILDFFDNIGSKFTVWGNSDEGFNFQCGYGYMWFCCSDYKIRSEAYKRVLFNITFAIEDKLIKDSKWLNNFTETK